MRNVVITRAGILKVHDNSVVISLVTAFRTVIGPTHIVFNSWNRFRDVQQLLKDHLDLFLGSSFFKLPEGDVFNFGHIILERMEDFLSATSQPKRFRLR